ncbi:retrovirus-related Pol polyprotein from transposon 412 [Trichonephila clavipes]|nr:retrovirus-related Pol polyprotein from transposon 412 [Trichonephila clavipes]
MLITRAIDEQLKALLEAINALKNSQEEAKNYLKEGQEETKQEMQKVEEEIALVEEKIERIKEQVEERIEGVAENFSLMSQRVEDLEKKLLASGNATNETKFVPADPVHVPSAVPLTASPVSVKLSTYDGKTNWEVYKTQFSIISEANGWIEGVKACQLAASLRGEAAKVLQTLPDTERLNLSSLYNALDLRFGQNYSKDYARLQMKTRLQKTGENLQEYASEVERFTNLALSDPHSSCARNNLFTVFRGRPERGENPEELDLWSDDSVREQLADPEIKPIIESKESSDEKSRQDIAPFHPTTKRYCALWNCFHLRNDVLYRKWESDDGKTFRWQLILPKTRSLTVLKELHDSPTGGHFVVVKTLQKVRERFYWNNVRSDVEKFSRTCDPCAARKGLRKRTRGRLQLYNVGVPLE